MRILLTADEHLGFKQYGFAERIDDFMLAVNYVFHQAQALGVDAVVSAGDTFQSIHPPAASVYFLYYMVQELAKAGIPIYGIDGNHDLTESAWMKVCGIQPLDCEDAAAEQFAVTELQDGVNIIGINGGPASTIRRRLGKMVEDVARQGKHADILVLHTELAELCGYAGADLTAAEVAGMVKPIGTRLVLMGHIHDYSETVIGDTRFIYSGSTEINASDERPDKSFSVIDITKDELKTSMYPIPVRPMFDVYIDDVSQLDELLANLERAKSADQRLPIAMVSYDPVLPDFKARATAVLENNAIYRLIPRPKSEQGADIFAQIAQQSFEKRGALLNLKQVVAQSLGTESDEYQLVLEMLESPDDVRGIVVRYAQSKGLEIK